MNRFWLSVVSIASAIYLGGCSKPEAISSSAGPAVVDPVHGHLLAAQPRLPTAKIWLGDQELIAEVARRPVEIATGMMFRTNMTDSEGMLFVFPDAAERSFYMRNCAVALSAGYIDEDGVIVETIDMQPFNETGIPSAANNIQFVLEVPQGWFQRHNVRTGSVIRTEHGDLQHTFFGN